MPADWRVLGFGVGVALAVTLLFGLAPVLLFMTGVIMWWNRVLSPWLKRGSSVRHPVDNIVHAHANAER